MQRGSTDRVSVNIDDIVRGIRGFLRERILPFESEWLPATFRSIAPQLAKLRAEVRARGWWAPSAPREQGGLGLGFHDFARVSEELGHSPYGHYLFGCNAPDAGNIELLAESGTAGQKERFLAPLVAGEVRSCFAMTERRTAGSNPLLLATRAVREGGEYVLDGEKWFTTGADGAAFAIVMAVTAPAGAPHERATLFLVPMDTPGLRLVRNVPVMGHVGDGVFSHGQLELDRCRVPEEQRLGGEGQGFVLAQRRLGPGRIHHASRWLGIAQRALDLVLARAHERAIAPGEKLAGAPLLQASVAESAAEIAAARAFVREVARQIDDTGTKEAQLGIGMLKFFVAGVLQRSLDRAVQAHGAYGLTDDLVLSHFFRQERAARIYDGPDEVHKLNVGAKLLRRSASESENRS